MSTLNKIINESIICACKIEDEMVIGNFVRDEYGSFTGIAFKSLVCPRFIEEINKTFGDDLTGSYSEVTDVKVRRDNEYNMETYVSFDEGETYHRVNILNVNGEPLVK